MTGISELAGVQVLSAAPDRIRVSVLGGRTQLDIALPLDVPVSGFVADLARLVRSRDAKDDEESTSKDERRTFWVLSRVDTGTVVRPEQSLREAEVENGELLRLTAERALLPPTLYDDVVDAAARLNKASYAAWDALSARWMAFVGVHLAAVAFVFCLVHPAFAAERAVIIGVAAAAALSLVGVAAIFHRSYRLADVAAALGWAAIPITGGIGWAVLATYGAYGVAGGCAGLLLLSVAYYRVVGTGHWAYVATWVFATGCGLAVLAYALGLRTDASCLALAVTALLACLLVPRLTTKLGRFEPPTVDVDGDRDEYAFENPFEASAATAAKRDADSGVAMPTAEAVWAHVHSAALTRSGLYTGLAASVAVAVAVLLRDERVWWPVFTFALVGVGVLGLRSRVPDTWIERVALGAPAVVLLAITCTLAQSGWSPIPPIAVGVLLAVAVGAVLAGLIWPTPSRRHSNRLATLLAYLEYLAAAALLPLALWVAGSYERLGPWW